MFVVYRSSQREPVRFDKIKERIEALCLNIEEVQQKIQVKLIASKANRAETISINYYSLGSLLHQTATYADLSLKNRLFEICNPSSYDETLISSSEIRARVEQQVAAGEKLLKELKRILASFEINLPEDPEITPVNFIKDNKIPAPQGEEHKRVRIPISMAEELANTLDLLDKEMAIILTISIRTYHRLKPNGLLNPVASERLAMLKELADYGLEVFEIQASFNQWLRQPLPELSNNSPLNSLDTAAGFNRVKTVLGRIDYGVYS